MLGYPVPCCVLFLRLSIPLVTAPGLPLSKGVEQSNCCVFFSGKIVTRSSEKISPMHGTSTGSTKETKSHCCSSHGCSKISVTNWLRRRGTAYKPARAPSTSHPDKHRYNRRRWCRPTWTVSSFYTSAKPETAALPISRREFRQYTRR